jgi:hypothetical protein
MNKILNILQICISFIKNKKIFDPSFFAVNYFLSILYLKDNIRYYCKTIIIFINYFGRMILFGETAARLGFLKFIGPEPIHIKYNPKGMNEQK